MAFGYLFASHPLFGSDLGRCRKRTRNVSVGRSEIVPHIGKHIVLWDTFAIGVHTPECGPAIHIPLLGG